MEITTYLDNLQAYNTNEGQRSRLDTLYAIQSAQTDYYYKGQAVPLTLSPGIDGLPRTQLNPLETYDVQFSVPPGSILTQLTAYSQQPEGFSVQITDAASGVSVFNTQDIRSLLIGNYENLTVDDPKGPSLFNAPLFFLNKGQVKVVLKNLSTAPNLVQLYMEFAIPNTKLNNNRSETI